MASATCNVLAGTGLVLGADPGPLRKPDCPITAAEKVMIGQLAMRLVKTI